ncbi:MAG: asparaginase domain-containing protein, partial [Candidatus Komeilibacteria bacterium]|nr:asparaginase domain-containing protein [Candidatus Komeilibacteria bacterium]
GPPLKFWQALNSKIGLNYDFYDGFIVVGNPNRLIYDAVAVRTAFFILGKPVVFTAAPFAETSWDLKRTEVENLALRTNLINSLYMVERNIPEVMIVFGQRVMAAENASKVNLSELDAFVARDNTYLAEFNVGFSTTAKQRNDEGYQCSNEYSDRLAVIYYHPALRWESYKNLLETSQALLIKTHLREGVDEPARNFLAQNFSSKPILIYNKLSGETSRSWSAEYGYVGDKSWERAVIRSMWCLAQTNDTKQFWKIYHQKI